MILSQGMPTLEHDPEHAALVRAMVAGFSHDLLQPLSAIGNYISAWRCLERREDDGTPPPTTTWLDEMAKAAQRAREQVRRFHDFALDGHWDVADVHDPAEWLGGVLQLLACPMRARRVQVDWNSEVNAWRIEGPWQVFPSFVADWLHQVSRDLSDAHTIPLCLRLSIGIAPHQMLEIRAAWAHGSSDDSSSRPSLEVSGGRAPREFHWSRLRERAARWGVEWRVGGDEDACVQSLRWPGRRVDPGTQSGAANNGRGE